MYFGKGNRKHVADYKSKEIYRFYKKDQKDKAVDYSKFWKVWEEFIDIRMQLVIYENLEFYMSNRTGSIRVEIVCDALKLRKDGSVRMWKNWGETVKLWAKLYPGKTPEEIKAIKDKPVVYYTNDHVDGKVLRYFWDKSTCNFKNHTHFKFEPIRKWQRKLAAYINTTKKLHYYGR